MPTKSCANCARRYTKDYGYSDYTVEGTNIHCRFDQNPGYPAEDPSIHEMFKEPHTYAEKCGDYFEGDSSGHFSVEDHVSFDGED